MKHNTFLNIITSLESVFGPIAFNESKRQKSMLLYWDLLKDEFTDDEFVFAGINLLQNFKSTKNKRFPLGLDFLTLNGLDSPTIDYNLIPVITDACSGSFPCDSTLFSKKALERLFVIPEWGEK